MSNFKVTQREFSHFVRNPDATLSDHFSDVRAGFYQRSIFNGIEDIISTTFIMLKRVLTDEQWHSLIQEFFTENKSTNPYFLEVPEEFVAYLKTKDLSHYPPFTYELAHYDWSELALDIAQDEVIKADIDDVMSDVLTLSPLSSLLVYQFPVHKINENFQPTQSTQLTYLLICRDSQLDVHYLEVDTFGARLYEILQSSPMPGSAALAQLQSETNLQKSEKIRTHCESILKKLAQYDFFIVTDY